MFPSGPYTRMGTVAAAAWGCTASLRFAESKYMSTVRVPLLMTWRKQRLS